MTETTILLMVLTAFSMVFMCICAEKKLITIVVHAVIVCRSILVFCWFRCRMFAALCARKNTQYRWSWECMLGSIFLLKACNQLDCLTNKKQCLSILYYNWYMGRTCTLSFHSASTSAMGTPETPDPLAILPIWREKPLTRLTSK